ncbi:MAG: DUF1849 family protein, partial [Alphaproteobacteria bacterium]|nr:DUF1849 family protein [Alphaproteobacteria bacterium]
MRRATLAKLCLASAAACASSGLWSLPAGADTKGAFRSHEARYAVTAAADAKAGLGVDGQLMVRLQATCRGWQQKQALILRITTPDDSELAMSSASQLAESYDGSTLAYQDETRINDEPPKVTRARATRPTP